VEHNPIGRQSIYKRKPFPLKISIWFTQEIADILLKQIYPKITSLITNQENKNKFENFVNRFSPYNSLGHPSEESFLLTYQLTTDKIVENSILYNFQELQSYELRGLKKAFLSLCQKSKIGVITETQIPVYIELIDCLSYIKSIQNLLLQYPKHDSDHKGTAHRSSSLKKLITSQIKTLEGRLDHTYFPITSTKEIEKIKVQLRFLKKTLEKEYSNLPEYFNYVKVQYGLDSALVDMSEDEQQIFDQLLNFYNGIKSSIEELLRSVMIELNFKFSTSAIDPNKKAEAINEVIRYLFHDELRCLQKQKNKAIFSKNDVSKAYKIKTILHDIPIFTFDHGGGQDFLSEFMTVGISAIMGIKNLFEPDKPEFENISNIEFLRNIIIWKNALGLTKEERKVFFYLFNALSNYEEGKYPLPEIIQ